jgi:transitional endoplasmic reticulum ATPase
MWLSNGGSLPIENGEIVRKWLFQILLPLGGHKELIEKRGFSDDQIAIEVGLGRYIDDDDNTEEYCHKSALRLLRENYREFQKPNIYHDFPTNLVKNISSLAQVLELSDVEQKILAFRLILNTETILDEATELLGSMSFNKLCQSIAVILDIQVDAVKDALDRSSPLAKSGLIQVNHHQPGHIKTKLDILSGSFAEHMFMPAKDPLLLLRDTISTCDESELTYGDFKHIHKSLDILTPYLSKAVSEKKRGVNVFIYGPPGTGKSQVSRVIAKDVNTPLYEISREDSDGDPIGATQRLRAFKAAQCIFSEQKSILLFDEVEDIFDDGSSLFGIKSTASKHKSWINRMLEDSPVPTIWLSNSVHCMDPAFIRRFDLIIELSVPPLSQRTTMVEKLCGGLVSTDAVGRIAASENVSPALISRATNVINVIKEEIPKENRTAALEHLIETTLVAQGHPPLKASGKVHLPAYYDPKVVNADIDLSTLATNLSNTKSGRLCIFGPPGTGKTAYGRYLADTLDIPLHIKRASDLMSKWVGGTEKNIARAFQEAEQENALLLIDEIDSFLQDRRNAQQSWEISGVNEMLTQMESFSGVFIASTNLMDGLDQAALRRFDIKTKFGYLRPEQAWSLFEKLCYTLSLSAPPERKHQLSQLEVLTPGDYAVITRRHRFQPFSSAAEMIRVLEEECRMKEDGKPHRSIGFIQPHTKRTSL